MINGLQTGEHTALGDALEMILANVEHAQAEKKTLPGVIDSFSGLCRVTATE